jgi:hypothetical protein
MTPRNNDFVVLPFRMGDLVDVMLVQTEADGTWRLPSGPSRKGVPQYECAAREARRQIGVSGQIYKRPLRPAGQDRSVNVFPLLVQAESHGYRDAYTTTRWFSLEDAAQIVDKPVLDALDAFVRRISWRAPIVAPIDRSGA